MPIEGRISLESVTGNLGGPLEAEARRLAQRTAEEIVFQMALIGCRLARLGQGPRVEGVAEDDRVDMLVGDLRILPIRRIVAEETVVRRVRERLVAIPSRHPADLVVVSRPPHGEDLPSPAPVVIAETVLERDRHARLLYAGDPPEVVA